MKVFLCLFFALLFSIPDRAPDRAPAQTADSHLLKLLGVTDENTDQGNSKDLGFRTASEDIVVEGAKLPVEILKQMRSESARKKITSIEVPEAAILKRTPVPLRVRIDCSELPLRSEDLDHLVESPSVRNQDDFLNQIPKGTLQVFTLVYESQSLQMGKKNKQGRGGVSYDWPRVIRTNADGKLTLSYVCDPENPFYGTIEMLLFDESRKSFEAREYDFRKTTSAPGDRIHAHPQACASCHSASAVTGLKPIWPEYFFWKSSGSSSGISVYGSDDDNLGFDSHGKPIFRPPGSYSSTRARDVDENEEHLDEIRHFGEFKKLQKENPCYASLPWAKVSDEEKNSPLFQRFLNYPYSNLDSRAPLEGGLLDYKTRSNLRFNDVYGHLNSQRLAHLISNSPEYPKIKYYLQMEEAGCLTSGDRRTLHQLLPRLKMKRNRNWEAMLGTLDVSDIRRNPLLLSYSKWIGIPEADWTLELKGSGPLYRAAIPNDTFDYDLTMKNVVNGILLKELAAQNLELGLDPATSFTRGVEHAFGKSFSCIDDLGGAMKDSFRRALGKKAFCEVLHKENQKSIEMLNQSRQTKIVDHYDSKEISEIKEKPSSLILNPESVIRGKELVNSRQKGNCISCHSTESVYGVGDLLFLPSPTQSHSSNLVALKNLKNRFQEGFLTQIQNRVQKLGDMPPYSTQDLDRQDREDIVQYIWSLRSSN